MLLYEAEIVTEVEKRSIDVSTVKVGFVAPAGTITLEGTLAAPVLLLESMICAPLRELARSASPFRWKNCRPSRWRDSAKARRGSGRHSERGRLGSSCV